MSEDRPSQVLGSLPRSRPHRRSDKRSGPATSERPAAAAGGKAKTPSTGKAKTSSSRRSATAKARGASPRLQQPPQPRGTPANKAPTRPQPSGGRGEVVGTAVQAAAELAEMGLSISARVLRGAISRLPRP